MAHQPYHVEPTEALGHYFTKIKKVPGYHCFDIDECEKCGKTIEAANSVSCGNAKRILLEMGLKFREKKLQEGYFHAGYDQVWCEDCFQGGTQ
ncbi:MAG: hypothetical protein QF864_08245 [SAR202 cluster bacterium]|jgi:hypothetical protein|nr:hypothetical protein [SAR202 cluster bacterium]